MCTALLASWKELRQRPTASYHATHSSEHLSCAIQTLKDPCPCSTCVSECYRAAVSGDPPPHSEQPQSCSFKGTPLRPAIEMQFQETPSFRAATELQFQGEHPQSHYCFLFAMPPSLLLGLGRWGQTVGMAGPSLASGFLRIPRWPSCGCQKPLPSPTSLYNLD